MDYYPESDYPSSPTAAAEHERYYNRSFAEWVR